MSCPCYLNHHHTHTHDTSQTFIHAYYAYTDTYIYTTHLIHTETPIPPIHAYLNTTHAYREYMYITNTQAHTYIHTYNIYTHTTRKYVTHVHITYIHIHTTRTHTQYVCTHTSLSLSHTHTCIHTYMHTYMHTTLT